MYWEGHAGPGRNVFFHMLRTDTRRGTGPKVLAPFDLVAMSQPPGWWSYASSGAALAGRHQACQECLYSRMMTTGQDAWCTQLRLTEPSRAAVKPPCPRLPRTSRSAPVAVSSST